MEFDDRPLDRQVPDDTPLAPPPRRASRTPVVLIAVLGLALGGVAAWWWSRQAEPPPAPPAAEAVAPEAPVAEEPPRQLPPLTQMDPFLRVLLGGLSSHPDLARWLATDDLIRQTARGVDRISRGQTPTAELRVLRPEGDFAVTRNGRVLTIDAASYRRYERYASLVESLDPQAVASAYLTIRPRLDEAYRSLGRSTTGVDQAVSVALQNLIDTPTATTRTTLVPGKGATYAFEDAQLEGLMPVQKQLLRMGPDNARRIQARLTEIKAAIDRAAAAETR